MKNMDTGCLEVFLLEQDGKTIFEAIEVNKAEEKFQMLTRDAIDIMVPFH